MAPRPDRIRTSRPNSSVQRTLNSIAAAIARTETVTSELKERQEKSFQLVTEIQRDMAVESTKTEKVTKDLDDLKHKLLGNGGSGELERVRKESAEAIKELSQKFEEGLGTLHSRISKQREEFESRLERHVKEDEDKRDQVKKEFDLHKEENQNRFEQLSNWRWATAAKLSMLLSFIGAAAYLLFSKVHVHLEHVAK